MIYGWALSLCIAEKKDIYKANIAIESVKYSRRGMSYAPGT